MVAIHDKQNGALPQRQIILKGSTTRVAVKAEPQKKPNQAHAAWRIRTLRHVSSQQEKKTLSIFILYKLTPYSSISDDELLH